MRSAILCSLVFVSATATSPACQSAPFREQVDSLIKAFRFNAPATGAYADGSARQTAQVLTAMGYCHRFYTIADGPIVRPALNFLVSRRGSDGLYRDDDKDDAVTTTSWVLEAMAVVAPREFAQELRDGAQALQRKGAENARPFGKMLDDLRTSVTETGKALEAMKKAGAKSAEQVAQGPVRSKDGHLDHATNVAALLQLVACQVVARGQVASEAPTAAAAPARPWHESQQRGFEFLMATLKDGVFMMPVGKDKVIGEPGLTALSLAAVQTKPKTLRTEAEAKEIEAGLSWLVGQARPDGWFSESNVNYVACAAVLALTAANDPKYKPLLDKVQRKILQLQNVEPSYARSDRDYGSIGYGGDLRGDLSNLQFSLESLRATGLDPQQSDAFAKAIVFLQRCQNLKAVNDATFEARDDDSGELRRSESGDDGGAAYYPGNSPMGYIELPNGARIARSYGSMTYALLKAYTLCGVKGDDPRVQAAVAWIGKNWTLDENPGADPRMAEATKYQGLYYYYMVAAQALSVAGIDTLQVTSTAGDGKTATVTKVDWRADIRSKLASLQDQDGSWVNSKNGRWWEKMPVTCTCYALLALDHCR